MGIRFSPPQSCRGLAGGMLAALSACGHADDSDATPDGPAVIATVPADGETAVDAQLTEITAIFSESMHMGGWSWVTEAGRSAPSVTGFPFYVDDTTAVLPVRLQPDTLYVLWVNSPHDEKLRKFANEEGVSAPAYRIRFQTLPDNSGF